MIVDLDECTGCNLCIIACRDEHVGSEHLPWTESQPDTRHFWVNLETYERGDIPKVKMTYLPLLCQHCEDAPCMKTCPENAIEQRDDGLVWINQEKCTGCGLCVDGCPYGVIYFNEELNVAQKCTWCAHLIDNGGTPRCADICPHDAILFGDENDPLIKEVKANTAIFHPEYETNPRVFYKGLPRPFIAGSVVDRMKGEILHGVEVTATDLFNDAVFKCTTDKFGDFWIHDLNNDHRYMVDFRMDGYDFHRVVVNLDRGRNLGDVVLKQKS